MGPMTETTITVRGTGEGRRAAQRAIVTVRCEYAGDDREQVVELATAAATEVAASLTELSHPTAGPVTSWSAERLNAWTERPYAPDGAPRAIIHHASVTTSATFVDFTVFADWVVARASDEAITVESISWDLLPEDRERMLGDVRGAAVADAVSAAQVYAAALGLSKVRAVALADPGLLAGSAPSPLVERGPMAFARAATPAGPSLSFVPEDIVVSVVVEARFVAE